VSEFAAWSLTSAKKFYFIDRYAYKIRYGVNNGFYTQASGL
jgi:hypothetical protein